MTVRKAPSGVAEITPALNSQGNRRLSGLVEFVGVVPMAMQLNILWLLGTLAGLVVAGAAPAAAAVAVVVRREMRGELSSLWPSFWRAWRENLVTANVAHLPLVVLLGIGWLNVSYFSATSLGWFMLPVGSVVLALLALALLWVAPLLAHYDMPLWRYSLAAVRLVLLRPLPSVVLLLVTAAIAFASYRWAILIPVISVGALLYAATWLGVRTFDDNEARLADPRSNAAPDFQLPTEPLRMH